MSSSDKRSRERRIRDDQIASEPPLPPLDLPPGAVGSPVESHMARQHQPVAVLGVVENGLVRPLDPAVKLAENARVIIVAANESSH